MCLRQDIFTVSVHNKVGKGVVNVKRKILALTLALLCAAMWTGTGRAAVAWGDRGADGTKIQQRLR